MESVGRSADISEHLIDFPTFESDDTDVAARLRLAQASGILIEVDSNAAPTITRGQKRSAEDIVASDAAVSDADAEGYFASYDSIDVHELMIKDLPRTTAYRSAIERSRALFQNAVVMDVGAGSGILSIFAAKAGAKTVYAVEASAFAGVAARNVQANGVAHIVQVIRSRVEDVSIPEKVDLIISEWMGFYLVHESMLDSVLTARDRFLKPAGRLFPQTATLWASPVCSAELQARLAYWDTQPYGIDLSAMKERCSQRLLERPAVLTLNASELLAIPQQVCTIDCGSVQSAELDSIRATLSFKMDKTSAFHGVALWFDVVFEPHTPQEVLLSTSPKAPITHWFQSVVCIGQELSVEKDDEMECTLHLRRAANLRQYTIEMLLD